MNQEVIIVRGNHTLKGDVRVSGAKNSALKLMAASILGQGETILHNVPLISDIELMSEVLARLGATVVREGHTLRINTADVDSCETPYELVSKMRASISVLGPLIGRFGEARVAMPGGCQIGARKIDMHLVGLEALGVGSTWITAFWPPRRRTVCAAPTCTSSSPRWAPRRTCSWPP